MSNCTMLRTDGENFIHIWNFIIGEWIVLSNSTVVILYLGQSLCLLNTHFHWGKFTLIYLPVIELFNKIN